MLTFVPALTQLRPTISLAICYALSIYFISFFIYYVSTYIHTCTNDLIRYPIQKNSKTCNHNYLGLGQGR